VIESIYFDDPNGYNLEIAWQARPLTGIDAQDAQLSLEAAMQLEAEAGGVAGMKDIDSIWRRKAELLEEALAE
jgi:hypothetical protein